MGPWDLAVCQGAFTVAGLLDGKELGSNSKGGS